MSEVTAQDLRAAVKSFWESKPDADFFRGHLNNQLAAFDAMAEKAEALDKLQAFADMWIFPRVELSLDGGYFVHADEKYHGNTIAEALKAVPE